MPGTWLVYAVPLLGCAACGPAGYEGPAPEARLHAIVETSRRGERAEARALVEQLDSDDPAVRLAAVTALRRLTGQAHGYGHADPPADREAAIARWMAAVGEPTGSRNDLP